MKENIRRGFTLTEVIIALSVISLLAVMLMPVAKQCLATAKTVRCEGNLRHIAIAFNQYAADNENRLPPSWIPGNNDYNNNWWYYLATYLGKPQPKNWADVIRICDPNKGPLGCPETNAGATGYALPWVSYKMARNFQTTSIPGISLLSIHRPAQTLLVSEGKAHPDFNSALSVSESSPAQSQNQGLVYAHGGKINALFVDGHIMRLDPKSMANIWTNAYVNAFQ